MEEWVAQRINNAHVVRAAGRGRASAATSTPSCEYIEGQTLHQWMIDNPRPALETVRGIVEQIARGLQAFHRLEMLHQDLRPQNVMIDAHRHGEDHRLRLRRASRAWPRARSTCSARKSSARCSTRRRNISSATPARCAFGPVLARRHRLPDAVGAAAVRRGGVARAQPRRPAPAALPERTGRRSRDPGVDRRGIAARRASGPEQAVRGAVGIRPRAAASECRLPEPHACRRCWNATRWRSGVEWH